MYTDREYYKPTDTIDVFGVIRARDGEHPLKNGEQARLKMGDIAEIPVTLDSYGTFAAKIPVHDLTGGMSIGLYLGEDMLASASIRFVDYPKNKYIVSATPKKNVYFAGEKADFDLSVTTYDKSPVAGVKIQNLNEIITTKADGTANAKVDLPNNEGETNGTPSISNPYFSLAGSEEYMQTASATVVVLPSDVHMTYEVTGRDTISFHANKVDSEAIERFMQKGTSNLYELKPEVYTGATVDMDFTLEVYKKTLTRKKVSETYDFIHKIKVPEYAYDEASQLVSTSPQSTVNGQAVVKDLPVSESPDEFYMAVIKFKDGRGTDLSFSVYYNGLQFFNKSSGDKAFYFDLQREKASPNTWTHSLMVNETGKIKLQEYSAQANTKFEGEVMTIVSRDHIMDTAVGSPDGVPITFQEDYIDNVFVFGAYFDGNYVYPVQYPLTLSFDSAERELNLDITNDKEAYKPGDAVTTTVKVTDKDGKPQKALVNLSVVDESVFAYQGHEAYFLSQYYDSIDMYQVPYYVYSSYGQYYFSPDGASGAEKGGGGNDYVLRDDFRDNPAFVSVQSDAKGIATFQYQLSDSITSWRMTAHGITKHDAVGNNRVNAIATLPYSIDMVALDEFVAGDDVCVLVKPGGASYVHDQTSATHTIEITQDDKMVLTDTKTSAGDVLFNAGKLPEGQYTVRVKSDCGDNKDAMEKKIAVVTHGNALPIRTTQLLSATSKTLTKVGVMGSPVRLTMANGRLSVLVDALYSCMNYDSMRTDEQAASAFGAYFLSDLRGEDHEPPAYINQLKAKLDTDLHWRQGIPEVSYGDAELFYTARYAAAFPELINPDELVDYVIEKGGLYAQTEDGTKGVVTPETTDAQVEMARAAGYFALASAGEPVLLEINHQVDLIKANGNQAQFAEAFQPHMRVLYYAAALCALGDDTGADALMSAYKMPQTALEGASDPATKAYGEEYVHTLEFYINTTLHPEDAYTYLKTKKQNVYVGDVCEKINFIKKTVPLTGLTSTVSYVLNGKTETVDLHNFDTHTITITKEQFEALALTQVSGETAVTIDFYGGAENLQPDNQKIGLQKNIVEGEVPNTYTVSFVVTIPDAKKGYYTIKDRVPSNMRFTASSRNDGVYVSNEGGQSVSISFYYDGKEANKTVSYDAVKINDAEAVTGAAYISDGFDTSCLWGQSK